MIDEFQCTCDCDCDKHNNRAGEQCDDCDNGTHFSGKLDMDGQQIYVNYEEQEGLR